LATYRGYGVEELVADLTVGLVSRALDDRQLTLHKQGRSFFHIAGAGHEALLVGLARSLRASYDWFFPYYRDLALCLALGITPYEVLLHSVGSADDLDSGGRQMPHHFGRADLNIVTQSSPTGSQCLPAIGCAEATRYIAGRELTGLAAHGDEITYVSIGEGATSEGEFWESLNTACRLQLNVLYLVADNGYAISVPSSDQAPAPISELVSGFPGLHVARFDGCDYFASRTQGEIATKRLRAGQGPVLLHANVTRPYSHSSSDKQSRYRNADELARERECDPLIALERELIAAGVLDEESLAAIHQQTHDLVAEAAAAALLARRPDPKSVGEHLLCLPHIPPPPPGADAGGEPVFFGEAIRLTLHELMAGDERIRVFGEDVADASPEAGEGLEGLGGVFGTTLRLQRAFGTDRCYNTPLAEANIVGRAVGQAIRGLRPCPEIQFFDYIWTAMQQIRSEAATTRWRSNGTFSVPMVLRCPIGGYVTGGAIWHSQSGESIFAHIPGLIVVFPSRARDAAGLLRAAFRCEDPVLFLEHKALLRQRFAMDPFPSPDFVLPLGSAATLRHGSDLTVVTWGATVRRALLASEELAKEKIDIEVIDLRTIVPFDKETLLASVARTSRLLVVHEDTLTAGFGAEIAAFAANACFEHLDAPVRRIGAADIWVPYEPTLERAVLPQTEDIVAAARDLVAY
jgi:2-oxoisovalerate dehydrogenase E1 component